ncbi:MFS transporter [Neptunitalea chrysea]|uniref:MFS transporter n=1 Tax=Neptunitalea chrysea TaxID=1647581 RepID=A0A9W6B421_9FLAO|nr:MFS transporter [Neptunitalea chrysea]GLB51422.1 MFS transporter [Neptunitalea chrysea]
MKLGKIKLSFWQIVNMNVGFFGIQYSFGLQQSAVNPIYDFLGATPDQIPILNLAGPVTGFLIQPIVGVLSDRTWHPKFGRRKPYFFLGAILCSLCLFIYPYSSSLWMAAGLLWILDVGNNMAMEPYRAFVADKLVTEQQPMGFQMQSFFTGLGQTLANLSIFIFPLIFIGKTGSLPTWVYASFFLGAVCSIGTIWWSMKTTKEIPPTQEELTLMKQKHKGGLQTFLEIFVAIKEMPRIMWQLALVYFFQWYALFCYWQNSSKSIALSVWNVTPKSNEALYSKAVSWTGLVNGWYNVVTFLVALILAIYAKKYGPKNVHFVCLLLAGFGFLAFPHISDKNLLFVAITGFGIGWASIMGIPYSIVSADIPKSRRGVYMGIINMMIVIPMIIQNLSFGFILKNFLNNDPRNAITFGGVFIIIAAFLTLLIKSKKTVKIENYE